MTALFKWAANGVSVLNSYISIYDNEETCWAPNIKTLNHVALNVPFQADKYYSKETAQESQEIAALAHNAASNALNILAHF